MVAGMWVSPKVTKVNTIYYMLWMVSWWLLGSIALMGRLDFGWLLAWVLILITLIPFRLLVTYTGGMLGVRGSALLKRRLLFGALKLDPDDVRHLGPGQLLGRVLETEVLDSMALTGGFLSITALLELILAAAVLWIGAGGAIHLLLLLVTLAGLFYLARRHHRSRRQWTERRVAMTDQLVERMLGHRTRLAQQPRQHWNEEEDEILQNYLGLSVTLDGTLQTLKILVPRSWFFAALVGLAPTYVYADPSSAGLAVAIGGILIVYRALRDLAEGMERLSAAAIAWDRIKLFSQAAARQEGVAASPMAAPRAAGESKEGRPLVDARDLVYQYPGRTEAVLKNVDLKIHRGDKILLEGRSGGGKSTLVALLATLRRPNSGLLLYQGLDRQTVGDTNWRHGVTLASQYHENHVLMGSFAFNLLMGRRWPPQEGDLEEAVHVCRSLGLGPLLERMPGGL